MVAQHAGAQVVVTEISSQRRESLAALGLDTLDPTATDQAAWVDDWTSGAGADVVFEVSGAAAAALAATDLVKARGTLVIVAIHTQPRPMDLHRVFVREIRILGARVYERTDFEQAIELLTSGVIPADGLITRIEPITATAQAFAELETGLAMKVLINVSSTAAAT
jgi:(R,R)-butanediol dehydrogenase/meso-butanediol dehydrogenase/diacetyl reductase